MSKQNSGRLPSVTENVALACLCLTPKAMQLSISACLTHVSLTSAPAAAQLGNGFSRWQAWQHTGEDWRWGGGGNSDAGGRKRSRGNQILAEIFIKRWLRPARLPPPTCHSGLSVSQSVSGTAGGLYSSPASSLGASLGCLAADSLSPFSFCLVDSWLCSRTSHHSCPSTPPPTTSLPVPSAEECCV